MPRHRFYPNVMATPWHGLLQRPSPAGSTFTLCELEHGHRNGWFIKIHPSKMVIFHNYGCLPEGILQKREYPAGQDSSFMLTKKSPWSSKGWPLTQRLLFGFRGVDAAHGHGGIKFPAAHLPVLLHWKRTAAVSETMADNRIHVGYWTHWWQIISWGSFYYMMHPGHHQTWWMASEILPSP